jgi:hypothetical protein
MFMGAIALLLVSIASALCGYCGVPDAGAAAIAQHTFLASTVGFAICALGVIAGLDEGFLLLRMRLSRSAEVLAPASIGARVRSVHERN